MAAPENNKALGRRQSPNNDHDLVSVIKVGGGGGGFSLSFWFLSLVGQVATLMCLLCCMKNHCLPLVACGSVWAARLAIS